MDRFRSSTRQQHVPIDWLADTLYEDDELSPEREHLKREESMQLHRAIKALPAEQQEVLHLRFGCGLRCTEIAPDFSPESIEQLTERFFGQLPTQDSRLIADLLVTQRITVVNPSGELQSYIFGAGQIASVDEPTTLLIDKKTGGLLAVLANNGQALSKGDQHTVQSYVSSADIAALSSIPLPADAPKLPPNSHGPLPPTYYNPAILSAYLPLPKIDPRVKALALQLTAGAHTMCDKAMALETYLRTNYRYTTNIHLPSGAEGVSWFLFSSGNQGFCNYFATAMAVMARELGMPARVVVGYTAGTYDAKTQTEVVRGSDAHAWTQIYFAGHGWINFEPSPSFPQFVRPL